MSKYYKDRFFIYEVNEKKEVSIVKYLDNFSVTEITIPPFVKYIKEKAFAKCKYVNTVIFTKPVYDSLRCVFEEFEGYTLTIKNLDLTYVHDLSYMFYYCRNLYDLKFCKLKNVQSVSNLSHMFCMCDGLTSLKGFKPKGFYNLKDVSGMFRGCTGLHDLDLGKDFNLFRYTKADEMFFGCYSLKNLTMGKTEDNLELIDTFDDSLTNCALR